MSPTYCSFACFLSAWEVSCHALAEGMGIVSFGLVVLWEGGERGAGEPVRVSGGSVSRVWDGDEERGGEFGIWSMVEMFI